jgi:hypothetical protein
MSTNTSNTVSRRHEEKTENPEYNSYQHPQQTPTATAQCQGREKKKTIIFVTICRRQDIKTYDSGVLRFGRTASFIG